MKGPIRQRSPGSWELTVGLGRDPRTGRRRQRWGSVRGARHDAAKKEERTDYAVLEDASRWSHS